MPNIKKEVLKAAGLPWSAIEDHIEDTSRWSVHHTIIFALEGKHYRAGYSVGATEQQDETPWEYEDEVECEEVHQVEVMVKQWVPVASPGDAPTLAAASVSKPGQEGGEA